MTKEQAERGQKLMQEITRAEQLREAFIEVRDNREQIPDDRDRLIHAVFTALNRHRAGQYVTKESAAMLASVLETALDQTVSDLNAELRAI